MLSKGIRHPVNAIRFILSTIEGKEETAWFFSSEIGKDYGVTAHDKSELIKRFQENVYSIKCASAWQEHLEMAAAIFSVPPSMQGAVLECGCFKGTSTANLSLACRLANRKLYVCDSFDGLPAPSPDDTVHSTVYTPRSVRYKKGQYRASLEEVQQNITRYGCIEVCQFVKGWFEDTLPHLNNLPLILISLDVDLNSSLRTCLKYLWPRLQVGSKLFSHEAQDLDFISLFFDNAWWQSTLGETAPGFIGAGCGLPGYGRRGLGCGYVIKPQRGMNQ